MAGRKKSGAGWGGKRQGAGGKPRSLTESQIEKLLFTAEKWEERTGQTIDDVLMSFIYGQDWDGEEIELTGATRMNAIKTFKEHSQGKLKEGGESDQNLGPGIFIPEKREDPALKVVGE